MCEIPVIRGFIVLLLGEVRSDCDMKFFNKSLKVIHEKICRILSQNTRLYLSFVPQDISPYNADDPIALTWELISDRDESHAHLCEKPAEFHEDVSSSVTSLDLLRLSNVLHGLLDQGIDKLGPSVLLDVLLVVSGSGVNQLAEGEGGLHLYGALRRVRWQNGHITAIHFLESDKHLLISPAVNSSVVMLPDEKLDCIDENIFWRGVFLPGIDPFSQRKREQQMRQLSLSMDPESPAGKKDVNKDKNSFRKKLEQECGRDSPLMILILKEIVKPDFPLFWLQHKPLKLYSTEDTGHRLLSSLQVRLAAEGERGEEAVAILSLIPCRLDKPLVTDVWYEYVIGKQPHWIDSIKLELTETPNYCLPSQSYASNTLDVWAFKQNVQIPDKVLEESTSESRDEESEVAAGTEVSAPVLTAEQLRVVCSSWSKLLSLSNEPDVTGEELECRINSILDSLPTPSKLTICPSSKVPESTQCHYGNITDSFQYKVLCSIDKYSNLVRGTVNCPMKSLGGLSPPPMTHNKSKIVVDSLLDSFDKEGHAIFDLEEVPLPTRAGKTDMRDRLSGNTAEAERSELSSLHYSWANFQTHLVKNETRGLMNYESPPKSKLAKSLFTSKECKNPRNTSLPPEPITFKNIKFCKENNEHPLPEDKDKKTETKTSKKKGKQIANKSMTEGKSKRKSGSEVTKDKELRTLLERAVVKALKAESLTREHPQFKSAYTQLFNVCKCFLTGLDAEAAREKVEQLATSNAKQVVELQTRS